MDIKKVGLLGGRGYVGQEIIELLANHEHINISSVFSSSKVGQPVNLDADVALLYQDLSIDNIVLADEDAFKKIIYVEVGVEDGFGNSSMTAGNLVTWQLGNLVTA